MNPKSKSKLKDKCLNDARSSKEHANEVAKWMLCSVIFGLSTIGPGALDSHAKGKKHNELVKSRTSAVDSYFYREQKDKPQSTNLFQSKLILSTTIILSF